MSTMNVVTCKGFQEDCSPYRIEEIYGKTLYLGGDICEWFTHACDFNCWDRAWNKVSSFDLSTFTLGGNEVAVVFVDLSDLITTAQYKIFVKWYDPDDTFLFKNESEYLTGYDRRRWLCWIGYCEWEIVTNGIYKAVVELYKDDVLEETQNIYFVITGVTCPLPTCLFIIN